ncbi:hypothetical protein GCM10025789_12580 [Tessaracoccus lubricantis]|uniref:Uncharacterized protein n=1 Tax=Tessaracoccus lubricantis TaxID=545543 RepID=A0ABP9FBJ8_9ACTN
MDQRNPDPDDRPLPDEPLTDEPNDAPLDPAAGDPAVDEPAQEEPRKRYADVSTSRRALWVVGGLVGVYMIGRGLYGMITGEEEQP